jgi:hypothetical protein
MPDGQMVGAWSQTTHAGAAMRGSFFCGRLAVAFALAAVTWGMAGAAGIVLGGRALEPQGETYLLSNHGHITEVAHGTWMLARACETTSMAGFGLMLLAALGIAMIKVATPDAKPGKNHAVLVLVCVVLSLAATVAASALATRP